MVKGDLTQLTQMVSLMSPFHHSLGVTAMHTEAAFRRSFLRLSDDTLEPSPYHAACFTCGRDSRPYAICLPVRTRREEEHEQIIALQASAAASAHPLRAEQRCQRQSAVRRCPASPRRSEADAGTARGLFRALAQLRAEAGTGQQAAVAQCCLALCSVPDLKLVPTEITSLPAVREYSYRLAPRWYVSPNFDSVQMLHDFAQQLNGGGCAIEQTYAYMDHKSAMDWISLCTTPATSRRSASMPHQAIVKRLREVVGLVGLDVIALGPGDGKTEVRLVQQILERASVPTCVSIYST